MGSWREVSRVRLEDRMCSIGCGHGVHVIGHRDHSARYQPADGDFLQGYRSETQCVGALCHKQNTE